MNSNEYIECENILEKALSSGRKVALVTAKDKLRGLLGGSNLTRSNPNGIALSTEFLKDAKAETHGMDYQDIMSNLMIGDRTFTSSYIKGAFSIYSGEASVNVLKLGVALIRSGHCDFAYLTLSDYIQHKYGPHTMEALEFYQELDEQIGALMAMDCVIGITADHGMNEKSEILYLQQIVDEEFDNEDGRIRVICPITDPYVVHHGSLGSFVYVYIQNDDGFFETKRDLEEYRDSVMEFISALDGVTECYCRDSATVVLQLPFDRIGDIAVISAKHVALGKTPSDHNLDHVASGLRTHGGRSEEMVPFIVSGGLNQEYSQRINERELRNFNIFDFVCNGTQ